MSSDEDTDMGPLLEEARAVEASSAFPVLLRLLWICVLQRLMLVHVQSAGFAVTARPEHAAGMECCICTQAHISLTYCVVSSPACL